MAEKTGYEIAIERIEEVARTGATELDLSGLGLTKIPDNLIYANQDLDSTEMGQPDSSRQLRVLLFHAEEDRQEAQDLYDQLVKVNWVSIRREEVSLFPSQRWDKEREVAIRQTDVFIVCFSVNSFDKAERLPKELSLILDIINEMPEGMVFIIPLRLDDCRLPNRFRYLQYGDYFPESNREWVYQHLLKSLKSRAHSISIFPPVITFSRSLKLFLCFSKEDEIVAKELYNELLAESWVDVWLSNKKILFGQNWDWETVKAMRESDLVVILFSSKSIVKEGYFQKELKEVLELAVEKQSPEKFVVPVRLDDHEIIARFRAWQHLDYFPEENKISTYYHLVNVIKARAMEVIPERFEKRDINLTSLNLSKNQIVSLPVEIGQFTNLSVLNLDNNQLSHLPPEISRIAKLTQLRLSNNRLVHLPIGIWQLSRLTSLDLSHNQIARLPLSLKSLQSLEEFDIRENLLPIPPEILEKVSEPQTILNYANQLWVGKRRPLSETKMIVVGQGSVGKTSLIRSLLGNSFNPSEIKTDGIAINYWQVPNVEKGENQSNSLRVNIWDFGGQEIMHATHQFFLTRRSLYMLVLDARISQEENRVEYWLKMIQSFSSDSPVLIVGNKIDQHPLDIDRTGLQKKYPNIIDILETSAADGIGLKELKLVIAEHVNKLPHIRDLLPEFWFDVKNQLEELGQMQNYISQDKYTEICLRSEVHDEMSQRTLIGFLHDLGVVLHFQDDPRLESLGILNPQWVTNGVYKILNAYALFQNKGVLERSMLADILPEDDYPANKRLFIVDMMRKFELCYGIVPEQTFLVPDLLPKDEPFTGEWDGALAFQYHYNVLPSSIVSRFIVRMNAYIHKTVWRAGVVLQKDVNTALVKADTEERKIYIWVNGAEHTRRDFLSAIRAEFEAIHKTIIKIEATEKVPVPEYPETEPIPFVMLLQAEREGRITIPVMADGKLIDVNVRELLNGVRVGDVPVPAMKSSVPSTIESAKVETAPGQPAAENQSLLVKILSAIFVSFPRIIGRFALDIFGRDKAIDSTAILLGYVLIVLSVLAVWGIVDVNSLRDWFIGWWRFFFPVKP